MKKSVTRMLGIVLTVSMLLSGMTVMADEPSNHPIINQVYGEGGKGEGAVTHNFIELYNPTAEQIDLSGYSVEVEGTSIPLTGTLPSHNSYLIRGKEVADSTGFCRLDNADLDVTDLEIDNKDFVVRLKKGDSIVDNVTAIDGDGILEVSKQKSIRRVDFQDTTEGDIWAQADFEIIEYKDATAEYVNQYRPRSLADGAWYSIGGSVTGGDANVEDENVGDEEEPEESAFTPIELPNTAGNTMKLLSSYSVGATNEEGGVAEIVKYNKDNRRMYVVSGQLQSVDIVDIHADGSTQLYKRLKIGEVGAAHGFDAGDITSVDVNTQLKIIALAVQSSAYDATGNLVLLDYDGNYLTAFQTGVQPDMVCFSPDGRYVMTADEGEPREGYITGVDPKGSVTLVELKEENLADSKVKICDFTGFDSAREQLLQDKVILKKGAVPSQDMEPEYIAVSQDSKKAYVSLQENNAIAVLDLATATFTSVKGLGFKDYNQEGNGLDLNKDGNIKIQNEDVYGVYMPDGLAVVTIGGVEYLITPNEGDAREWGSGDSEYTNIDSKKINGSEKKVEYLINEESDGLEPDKTYILGGRSFSIFRGDTMELIYDSGKDFEEITASYYPEYFNSNHKDAEMDGRSNKKGPEPEDAKVLMVDNKIYAFIGLERIGGIMMYDITNPRTPVFVDYLNNRNFTEKDLAKAGDIGAEGICTVEAQYSPTNYPLILVANEISGTVSVIGLNEGKYIAPEETPEETSEETPEKTPEDESQEDSDNGSTISPATVHQSGSAITEIQADWKQVEDTLQRFIAEQGEDEVADCVVGNDIVIPADIYNMIAGKDIVVAFHTGDGIAISVDGKGLKVRTEALDLSLSEKSDVIPQEILQKKLQGSKESRQITFSQEQELPGGFNLHLAMGTQNAGFYANLYRYDNTLQKLVYEGSFKITESGHAMFALGKTAAYLVTVTNSIPEEMQNYVVMPGDTLGHIAAKFRMGLAELLRLNPQITDADKISIGQRIVVK